jgi:hypothetical protein
MKNVIQLSKSYCSAIAGVIIAIMTAFPASAGYTPPQGNAPTGPTVANGSRGACENDTQVPLLILAPMSHVGRSTTTQPSLSWFVPASKPYRVEVTFYRQEDNGTLQEIYLHEAVENTGGIIRNTLPTGEVLQMGQRYSWQVAIACDPDSPTYDQTFTATIDLVAPPADLTAKIAAAQTKEEKSTLYAEAGYWYDSLREASEAQLQSLVQQLAALEPTQQGQFLQQIATRISTP